MNRREFVAGGTALLGHATYGRIGRLLGQTSAPTVGRLSLLETISENVSVFHDVVNVGVIQAQGKILLIDSGESSILDSAPFSLALWRLQSDEVDPESCCRIHNGSQ